MLHTHAAYPCSIHIVCTVVCARAATSGTYGGLMRSVELHTMSHQPLLWRVYALPANANVTDPQQSSRPDSVDLMLQMSSADDKGSTVEFFLAFDGGASVGMHGIVSDKGQVQLRAQVPNAELWSPTSPRHSSLSSYGL